MWDVCIAGGQGVHLERIKCYLPALPAFVPQQEMLQSATEPGNTFILLQKKTDNNTKAQ